MKRFPTSKAFAMEGLDRRPASHSSLQLARNRGTLAGINVCLRPTAVFASDMFRRRATSPRSDLFRMDWTQHSGTNNGSSADGKRPKINLCGSKRSRSHPPYARVDTEVWPLREEYFPSKMELRSRAYRQGPLDHAHTHQTRCSNR